jgi:hypothetical protein
VCHIDNDQESGAAHLDQVLPETSGTCPETYDMIQKAFGSAAIGRMQVMASFRLFKDGGTSVDSDEHSGRPLMSRNQLMIDKLRSTLLDNWGITIT